jgi:hypothetical protein
MPASAQHRSAGNWSITPSSTSSSAINTRTFTGTGPIGDVALALFDKRAEAGAADAADGFDRFIDQHRKLLIYHGFSDPALTAFRSIMLYEDLAHRTGGGIEELQENVRMFLVPGMRRWSGAEHVRHADGIGELGGARHRAGCDHRHQVRQR